MGQGQQFDSAEAQTASHGDAQAGVAFMETQGRTSQEIQAFVRDLAENNPNGYRTQMDAIYNKVYGDAKSNPSLNGLLPQIDLSDAAVDPKGAAGDRANFTGKDAIQGVQTDANGHATEFATTAADGKSGMYMNDKGQATAFNTSDQGVQVTSTGADGSVNTFNHTDIDPKSVKLDQNTGDLTMSRTGLGDGMSGNVTIHPGGSETTHLQNKDGSSTDIDRSQAAGDITGFHSTAKGMQEISCENGQWKGLPNASDGNQPQHVQVDSKTGQLSYDLPQGFPGHEGKNAHVTLGADGKPTYEQKTGDTTVTYDAQGNATQYAVHNADGDFTLAQRDGKWWYNKTGSDTYVSVADGFKMGDDGKVKFTETGWAAGKQHTLGDNS